MKKISAALVVSAVALSACTTRQVVENTGDAALGTTKLIVRGAIGAGKLAVRGTVAGVRKLSAPEAGFKAGQEVCVTRSGEVVGRVDIIDGQRVCTLTAVGG
jgi:hypothetical protein